jgi:uncharacterized membrane protein YfcA
MSSTLPDPHLFLVVGAVLALATVLQWAAGFGFGLFAIPLLLLFGLEPEQAISVIIITAGTQMISGLWRHRREAEWRQVLWMVPFIMAAQPLGVWVLGEITVLDKTTVQSIFGGILLLALAVHWWVKPTPRDRLHPAWSAGAAAAAGGLGGMAGMSGPPLVLWVMAHRWSAWKSRATLWALFLLGIPTNLTFLILRFGSAVVDAAGMALWYIPVVLVGMLPGTWLGNRIPKSTLRRLAFVILFVVGVWALSKPVVG